MSVTGKWRRIQKWSNRRYEVLKKSFVRTGKIINYVFSEEATVEVEMIVSQSIHYGYQYARDIGIIEPRSSSHKNFEKNKFFFPEMFFVCIYRTP